MDYTFKKHPLSEPEKLWIEEVSKQERVDPKIIKIKLLDKIPLNFEPNNIDRRLYSNHRITAIGLWHVDPNNPIFDAMDKVISFIRRRVIETPGIEQFAAKDIAEAIKIDEKLVGRAMFEFGQLGSFYSEASGTSTGNKYVSISLTSENAYDEYIKYKGIDDLLERVYVIEKPSVQERSFADTLWHLDAGQDDIVTPSIERKSIKRNTAFVLMAIDRGKPELTDVYIAIKRVFSEFGIKAYNAAEIEHQERITDVILREISACEFLIADLTYERPNVYYEVGYAHAMNKKPILYRRQGTALHFDLVVHNVPEYANVTELEEKLRKRLEEILGRKGKSA